MMKKVIAMLLVFGFIFGLVGCTKTSDKNNTDTGNTKTLTQDELFDRWYKIKGKQEKAVENFLETPEAKDAYSTFINTLYSLNMEYDELLKEINQIPVSLYRAPRESNGYEFMSIQDNIEGNWWSKPLEEMWCRSTFTSSYLFYLGTGEDANTLYLQPSIILGDESVVYSKNLKCIDSEDLTYEMPDIYSESLIIVSGEAGYNVTLIHPQR